MSEDLLLAIEYGNRGPVKVHLDPRVLVYCMVVAQCVDKLRGES